MKRLASAGWALVGAAISGAIDLRGEQRFPPPDFEGGYQLPVTATPGARSLSFEYLDVAVLLVALVLASYFTLRRRSRPAVLGLSLFSLAYFGFYREGCICAIGSVQNVALGLFGGTPVPLVALAFFLLPLIVALFAGRAFCSSVCPHGALQDLVLLKPVKVPGWLEHGLGLFPFFYLGAAVVFAATGSAFLICRYDPFVPLFRLAGSLPIVLLGVGLLLLGTVVGRPYCRFLCPYGALLKLGAKVSKWRVTVTPDTCTQCRLCENSCPYGAIQTPATSPLIPATLRQERRRLNALVLLLPVLVAACGWIGSRSLPSAARLHPTVELAEHYLEQQAHPTPLGVQTAPALAFARAEQDPKTVLSQALKVRARFATAGWWLGGWMGLVIGAKLIGLSLRHRRTDFEPDRGGCLSCARCFRYCPSERARCGLTPEFAGSATTLNPPAVHLERAATTQPGSRA